MEIKLDQSITPFNLEHTLSCGQVFRWEKVGDQWYGVINENIVKIRQAGDKLLFQTFPERVGANFVEKYFRLGDDLPHILFQVNKDEHMRRAVQSLYGLRIVRQEPWECLISYMCATNTNISAIKNMIFNLSKRFGRNLKLEDRDFYTFPRPSELAEADLEEIKGCKLGFRAERVLETSRIIGDKEVDLEAVRKMDYKRAKHELMSLPGVGQKVADCVLLFSLDKLEAFPVDVWIKRIILESYTSCFERFFIEKTLARRSITPQQYEKINSFGRGYFGEYAGYAQEYLFYYHRISKFNANIGNSRSKT